MGRAGHVEHDYTLRRQCCQRNDVRRRAERGVVESAYMAGAVAVAPDAKAAGRREVADSRHVARPAPGRLRLVHVRPRDAPLDRVLERVRTTFAVGLRYRLEARMSDR